MHSVCSCQEQVPALYSLDLSPHFLESLLSLFYVFLWYFDPTLRIEVASFLVEPIRLAPFLCAGQLSRFCAAQRNGIHSSTAGRATSDKRPLTRRVEGRRFFRRFS